MNDPWKRFYWWPSTLPLGADADSSAIPSIPSGGILGNLRQNGADVDSSTISSIPSGGILGNLGQNSGTPWMDARPAPKSSNEFGLPVQQPWGSSVPYGSRPAAYDPDILRFRAAWRGLYSLPPLPTAFLPLGPSQSSSPFASSVQSFPPTGLEALSGLNVQRPSAGYPSPINRYRTTPAQSGMQGASEFGRDSALAQRAPILDPSSETTMDSESYPAMIPAGYQSGTRPWWAPVPPPSVFDPWREDAIKGLQGLYEHFSRPPSYPSGGNRNAPGCKEEWDAAYEDCANWLSSPNRRDKPTGGHLSIEDCARGLVSERCGGNELDRGRKRK
jgi:hypothetical protein